MLQCLRRGILDNAHALPVLLQDLPEKLRGTIDVGATFNFNMPRSEYSAFFKAAYDILQPNGQLIMTVAEDEILGQLLPVVNTYFTVMSTKLFNKKGDFPHKNLLVLSKKIINS